MKLADSLESQVHMSFPYVAGTADVFMPHPANGTATWLIGNVSRLLLGALLVTPHRYISRSRPIPSLWSRLL